MSLFLNPLLNLAEFNELSDCLRKKEAPVKVSDISGSGKAHFISELLKEEKTSKLIISYDEVNARQLYDDLSCFFSNVLFYPARDFLFFSADIQGHLISKDRISVWQNMSLNEPVIVVCVIDALFDRLESPLEFKSNIIHINENDKLDLDKLSKKLAVLGYERVSQVEDAGQFCIRGGIIDIYPMTAQEPVRIELWDEDIDSIRNFDIKTQRSTENIADISIYPAKEKEAGSGESFLSYFNKDESLVFLDEPGRVFERAYSLEEEFLSSMKGRLESRQVCEEEIPKLFSASEVIQSLNNDFCVAITAINKSIKELNIKHSFSISSRQVLSYKSAFEQLISDLKALKRKKHKTVLLTASKTRAERLAKNLREYELSAFYANSATGVDIPEGQILVMYGNLHKGFEYPLLNFSVLSESDIFGKVHKKKYKQKQNKYEGKKIISLNELNFGDYVIHEEHGLGVYRGLEKIERDDIIKDYIKIEYAGNANCYLPATKLELIQKYATQEAKAPKLNKLGNNEWIKTKTRVKSAIENIAKELVTLYAQRLNAQGFVYSEDTVWQREFEEMFPFEETVDQLNAIADIKSDMQSTKIMDRLICGDVGYGKTEIALRAAFKAVQENRQVIYLVPTTILAEQHYNTFIQRMKDFPVRVDLMCRFRTAAEQKKTLDDFKKGLVDIIIGTHRVLSKDIIPKNLGLLIVDEEQRFGVKHKEKLKQMKKNIDVLTLSATPIPRTLHMSLVGIRDLSVLEEAPMDRLPIQTYVMEYYDETVKEAIKRELGRNGQVYYVYNRVSNIEEISAHIQALVPDANVAYAHGQMPEKQLESIMLDFINGEIDVLVSTTIIETGLDIPNANTMLIHDADKLGLSQLYQLRGRVGRSNKTSYAFLLYKRGRLLTEEAEKRLKAIREFTELGSGIKIAMRDLEIRGAGNVLGSEQHGHMQAVGYDLYCKMLNTAIKALRGEDIVTLEFETGVEAPISAYIPGSYIKNEEQKLDIYKKISSIETFDDYQDMQDELIDRFGDMPKEVENLLTIARLKSLAHSCFIKDVLINRQEIRFVLYEKSAVNPDIIKNLLDKYEGELKIKTGNEPFLFAQYTKRTENIDFIVKKSLEILKNFQELIQNTV